MSEGKFLNLEKAVMEWAWTQYSVMATRKEKRLQAKEQNNKGKYINYRIDWRDVRVTDRTTWSPLEEDTSTEESDAKGATSNPSGGDRSLAGEPRTSVLFETKFINNTSEPQNYTMKTEKTTRSVMQTSVESGYTRGYEMSLKLASPCQVFEANAGFRQEVSLSKVEGESFEEELTWGVESQILVNKHHIAAARLVVDEKRQSGSFVVESRLRGMVYVTFLSVRDNNSQIKAVGHDLDAIVKDYLARERKIGHPLADVDVLGDGTVVVKTKGSCKFRYGIKQHIRVDQIQINEMKTPNCF